MLAKGVEGGINDGCRESAQIVDGYQLTTRICKEFV
jgi:hypothetical protein